MRFLVTGATGLIGSRLCQYLQREEHEIAILSRSKDRGRRLGVETFAWQPEKELPPAQALEGVEVIVHLAGENIAARRWTEEHKRCVRDSRILSTRNLVAGLREAKAKPQTFICASAVGFYGDRGDQILTERSAVGTGFLSEVCQEWENEAMSAAQLRIRVVQVRIGIVLAKESGALQQMLPIFKFGLGGSLGSGRQWFPWIHIDDLIGILHHTIFNETIAGPINAVAPGVVTNADFTATLATTLHRPAVFAVPSFVLRLGIGEMTDALLGSARVVPEVAISRGYQFRFPLLQEALKNLLQ